MVTLTAPDAVAMDSQKLEQVKQLFQRQIAEGLHPGAGLAAVASSRVMAFSRSPDVGWKTW